MFLIDYSLKTIKHRFSFYDNLSNLIKVYRCPRLSDLDAVVRFRSITTKCKDRYFDCLAIKFAMFITMDRWPKVRMLYIC